MNRTAHTPSALLALARSRRMQRALAHARLARHAPMPTLRSSLGYVMSTACVTDDAPSTAPAHHMAVLGIARREGVAYVLEELGAGEAPIVYRLWLRGPRQGYLVPIHGWYEHAAGADEIRARLAALAPTLDPVLPTAREAWMLSTRVIQRRALRVAGPGACADLPIRKFALQLLVEPVSGGGPSGKTTVTAYLRPQAQLAAVWLVPGTDLAIARLSFTGIPSGVGLTKDTVVLLTSGLDHDAPA